MRTPATAFHRVPHRARAVAGHDMGELRHFHRTGVDGAARR